MLIRSQIARSTREISAELSASGPEGKRAARRDVSPVVAALPKVAGLAVIALASGVLLGWIFNVTQIKSIFSELETLKPITAITFMLSGALLVFRAEGDRLYAVQRSLSTLVLIIGLLTLFQFSFGLNFLVGDLLTSLGWSADSSSPMSVPSAIEFTLFAAAMLLPSRSPRGDLAFVTLTVVGMFVALLIFAGYLYRLPILYEPIPGSPIALHAAILSFVLFIGAALTRPNTGWVTLLAPNSVTGSFAPWLLPAVPVLPLAFGWFLNEFIVSATTSPELGVKIFAISSVLVLAVVVWRTGHVANRLGRNIELREHLEARLREARAAAEDAAAAKSEFLANMTHELRTPLNSIVGFAGLLAKSPKLNATNRRFARIIDGSSQSLLALVNDILDFSSLEAGAVSLHPVPFSLPRLVQDIVASVSLMADEKNLKLKIEKGSNVGEAHFGDVLRLHQVLLNVINNAIKFTSHGGITIAVSAAEHSDSVQHLRIEVRDTGIGISKEKLDSIFNRFSQADASIHGRFGGTGLGLAISKRLIELMGGNIGAESLKGKGTTVWIELTLPCMDPEALLDAEAAEEPLDETAGRRILVVDDVDLNRDLVVALLAPRGHTVDQAEDGAEAVERVKAAHYDLVLMDVQMPGMNGMEATRIIRAIDGLEGLPIVAMTAQALKSQWEACREAGMSDHLPKPITPAALFATLSKWTEGADAPPDELLTPDVSQELRDEFVRGCAQDLARIRVLLNSSAPSALEELRRVAHRISGTGAMVGLADLSQEAGILMDALAESNGDVNADGAVTRLERLIEAA